MITSCTCTICGKQFKYPYLLNKHHETNKRCKENIAFTTIITELKESLRHHESLERSFVNHKEKYQQLRIAAIKHMDKYKKLEEENKELQRKMEIMKLEHRLKLAETKCELYERNVG